MGPSLLSRPIRLPAGPLLTGSVLPSPGNTSDFLEWFKLEVCFGGEAKGGPHYNGRDLAERKKGRTKEASRLYMIIYCLAFNQPRAGQGWGLGY